MSPCPLKGRSVADLARQTSKQRKVVEWSEDLLAKLPEYKDQVACLKMCIDRLLPLSHFEKDKAGRSNAIQVQIVTTGSPQIAQRSVEEIDYEVIDVNEEEQ